MLRGAGFEICSVSCWQSFPTNLIQNTTQIMQWGWSDTYLLGTEAHYNVSHR